MYHIGIDDYVINVLLPDLAGHDRSPAAFLVYLVLWTRLFRSGGQTIRVSLQSLSTDTLSKSAVQAAIRLLKRLVDTDFAVVRNADTGLRVASPLAAAARSGKDMNGYPDVSPIPFRSL